jgi:hypothetical protein
MNHKKILESNLDLELELEHLDNQHKQLTQDQLEEIELNHENLIQSIKDKSFYSELRRIDL